MRKITMLGTGLIGMFTTMVLYGQRNQDKVYGVYSRSKEWAKPLPKNYDADHFLVKDEKMSDDNHAKCILKKNVGSKIVQKIV